MPASPPVSACCRFQHTAARRRLGPPVNNRAFTRYRFNTQPPEGGWALPTPAPTSTGCFNTQPPEGGWFCSFASLRLAVSVSTHSRPKAAGAWPFALHSTPTFQHTAARRRLVSYHITAVLFHFRFNTQPPEGGWVPARYPARCRGRFNTQPPEGGWRHRRTVRRHTAGFNTQPPEGGWMDRLTTVAREVVFQHTAARRRLEGKGLYQQAWGLVSTHSRPKAAGRINTR